MVGELVAGVQASSKYSHICPSLVREIVEQEAGRHAKKDEVIKHIRSRLHQAAAAYFVGKPSYDEWLIRLKGAAGNAELTRQVCKEIMSRHASSSERLDYLEEFYKVIGEAVGPVRSVADLACGLNPLAAAWMKLEHGCTYLAVDVYSDMAAFLTSALPTIGVQGRAIAGSVLERIPDIEQEFDLVLLLKTLPCLEQLRKGSGLELLRRIRARLIAVSYPALSLGGRRKGMEEFYHGQFSRMLDEVGWKAKRIQFPGETLYIVRKTDDYRS